MWRGSATLTERPPWYMQNYNNKKHWNDIIYVTKKKNIMDACCRFYTSVPFLKYLQYHGMNFMDRICQSFLRTMKFFALPSGIDRKWIPKADTLYNTKNNLPETAGACIWGLLLFLNFAVTWKRKQIYQLIFSVVDPDSTRFLWRQKQVRNRHLHTKSNVCGSVTFRYGSGSISLTSSSGSCFSPQWLTRSLQKVFFFKDFLLITIWRYIYNSFNR